MTARFSLLLMIFSLYCFVAQASGIEGRIVSETVTREEVELAHPVLKMNIIEIHSTGKVSSVVGSVEYAQYLTGNNGFEAATVGTEIKNDTMVLVHAGAALVVDFENRETVEFKPAEKDRHVIFKLQ